MRVHRKRSTVRNGSAVVLSAGEIVKKKTNARSLLGSMNEFAHLADVYRHSAEVVDLTALSLRLAETPCSPLYKRHITPHDELMARAAV